MRTYKCMGTKVKPEVKESIGRLCKARGLTEYELLQMMCDCIVRYMDDEHNLSPELEEAMAIFEHMEGWSKAYNLADPTTGKEIVEAVYVAKDPNDRKHGNRASLVRMTPTPQQTDNVTTIHERMTEVLLPEIYRKLRHLAVELDCKSIVELLHKIIDERMSDTINAGYRKEFEDVRADNGKPLEYGKRTRRKKKVTPDELEEKAGFKPFGGEW